MRAGDSAHEQDDRHHHQPRCDDGRSERDLALAVKQAPARGDEHEHERAEQLGEQAAPLEPRVFELGLGAELQGEQVHRARAEQTGGGRFL